MKIITSLLRKVLQTSGTKPVIPKPVPKAAEGSVFFGKYLLATNTISSGLLMVAGDLFVQEFEYQKGTLKKRYDWKRSGKMFIVGSIQGPLHHYFYAWMDKAIKVVSVANVSKKVLLDQVILSPVIILAFLYPAGWLNNQSTKECNEETVAKFGKIYAIDWCLWPPSQFINFYYLDPKYRVIYVNFVTMIFNVVLSYIKYEK
ncbi:hypothetical protein HA402_007784 [Bradysia odoriphaga]|nr:hypothetical protein HA402_007784 [Bradysia odoriphaga]